MHIPVIEQYIDELIERSTLDVPAWNIEKAKSGLKAGWNYIDGCMILALLETYNTTGEKKYLDFADAFIDHRVMEDGTIAGYKPEDYNIDNVNAGKTLFLLYDLTGKEKYRKAIDVIYEDRAGCYRGGRVGRGRGARLPHSGGLPPHRHRELLAQGHLSGSGLAGRALYGTALLYGI